MLKIGITGHRDLKKEKTSQYIHEVSQQLKRLKFLYNKIIIYSALSDGADRLVVNEAIKRNIDFIAVLPMPKDLYLEDFDDDSKNEFEKLIKKSKQVIEIDSLANQIFNKNIQYELAGHYISDQCNVLFALWDGKYNGIQGGTSEIVKYHLNQNKPLWHLKVLRNSI